MKIDEFQCWKQRIDDSAVFKDLHVRVWNRQKWLILALRIPREVSQFLLATKLISWSIASVIRAWEKWVYIGSRLRCSRLLLYILSFKVRWVFVRGQCVARVSSLRGATASSEGRNTWHRKNCLEIWYTINFDSEKIDEIPSTCTGNKYLIF